MRIGFLIIATQDYVPYAERLLVSARRWLLPAHEIVPFVFKEKELRDRVGFPNATLYRYHVFLEHVASLSKMDYLFYCDADMLFVDRVGEEVLESLVVTQHPGYVGRQGPYEARPESTACVTDNAGRPYVAGGFLGGQVAPFFSLASTIAKCIDIDDAKGITAVWHDESHLNRYIVDNQPARILTPSYCYPEIVDWRLRVRWHRFYHPRLVALDKNRGRHRIQRRPSSVT